LYRLSGKARNEMDENGGYFIRSCPKQIWSRSTISA
jgi:hypothetical protein